MPGPLDDSEQLRRYSAYEDGDSDLHSAELLEMAPSTFRAWRTQQNLPVKRRAGRILSNEQIAERLEAYEQCDSIQEAAARLCITDSAMRQWALSRGLELKRKQRWITPEVDRLRQKAYDVTDCDQDAAYIAGCAKSTFAYWRRLEGLPAKGVFRHQRISSPEEEAMLINCWATMDSFREIALFLDMDAEIVAKEIRILGLGPLPRGRAPGEKSFSDHQLRMWRAMFEGTNDRDCANIAGTAHYSFNSWRKRFDIPPHTKSTRFWARAKQEALMGNPIAGYYYKDRYPRTHGLDE